MAAWCATWLGCRATLEIPTQAVEADPDGGTVVGRFSWLASES
jgi:hypothetical protein